MKPTKIIEICSFYFVLNLDIEPYWVKHYKEGSEFGIDGGKISKLECRADGKMLLHYERGWDMEPETELGYQAYAILTKMYN